MVVALGVICTLAAGFMHAVGFVMNRRYVVARHTTAVRLLVISPRQSASMQQQSIAHGAQSVLVKPLVVRELVELIRTLLTV